jgi:putative copper export protein
VSVLTVGWDTIRVFLHVLAATIWVGGQLTLAALVPPLRALGRELTTVAARAFNRVAWPAFGVLVVTGVWNVLAEREHISGATRRHWSSRLVLSPRLVFPRRYICARAAALGWPYSGY